MECISALFSRDCSELGFVLVASILRHVVKSVVVSEMARRLEQDGGGNVIGLLRLDQESSTVSR